MSKKRIIIIIFVILAAVLLIKGKGLLEKRRAAIEHEALPSTYMLNVTLVKAEQDSLQNRVTFLAQVLSDKSITLSTKLTGFVEKIFVEESQKVHKGDLLASIDAFEVRSNIDTQKSVLKAQESDLALARGIYERNKKLYAIGGLSKEQLASSKVVLELKASAVEGTKQKIEQLQHQLSYLKIVAPFDGEIDAVLLHEGDLAAAGKPILKMSDMKKKLVFSYSPGKKEWIKKEQDVFLDGVRAGYVRTLYTTAQNGLTSVEVTLNREITAPVESSVTIEVLTDEKKGCTLPDNTLLHKKEGIYVMQYEQGRFTPLKVNVEMQDKNRVLISPCPKEPVAQASEVKLAQLPGYGSVTISGVK